MASRREAEGFGPIAHLAGALLRLREGPAEIAVLVEAAIVEYAAAAADGSSRPGDRSDLAAYLRYALDDVAKVTPAGAGLLRLAIERLHEASPPVRDEARSVQAIEGKRRH